MHHFTAYEIGVWWSEAVRNNHFYSAVIDGDVGSGKTTLASSIAYGAMLFPDAKYCTKAAYSSNMMRVMDEQMVYMAEMEKQLADIKALLYRKGSRYTPIIVDESKAFYKLKHQRDTSQDLAILMGVCRKAVSYNPDGTMTPTGNRIFIFCLDEFTNIVKGVRDSFRVWFRCMDRGIAAMFIADRTPSPDKFFLDIFQREKMNFLKRKSGGVANLLNINQQLALYSKMPSFVGTVSFPRLPEEVETHYEEKDALSKKPDATKIDLLGMKGKREEKYAEAFAKVIRESGKNPYQVEKLTGISHNTVDALLERFKNPSEPSTGTIKTP